ncbi:MAG: 3-hydroxyacyl-CoA dehydrogenase NAD-binding domain-containing protein [Gammaproteobacteria bacterium]
MDARAMTTLQLAVGADGIAVLTIDVPDRSMNVVTPEFQADLAAAIERITKSAEVRGAVITSGKSNSFLAGADLKDLATAYDRGITAAQGAQWSQALSAIYRRLETCGKPVAAAINGLALGGGLELALACHYRVLADHPKAVVGTPEVTVGLLPGAGGTQRLPRLIGVEKSLPLLAQGTHVKPQDALKLGVVHELAPADQVIEAARRWLAGSPDAQAPWDRKGFRIPGGTGILSPGANLAFMTGTSLTAKTTQHNYPAPIAILSCVFEGTQVPIDLGLRIESKYFGQLLAGPVARNLMRTMFVNRGLADKLARRPAGVPKSEVKKLGLLGAGMMGAGIAYVSARAGMDVVLLDSTLELAEKGKSYSASLLRKEIERGRATQAGVDATLARIKATTDYTDLAGCDLVIEAVFENRAIKADVTRKAEDVMPKAATFASNTSTLPITGLAQASKRPKQFIGVHFFSPVEKMPLVEIIVGKKTSEETIARALDYVGQLKKTPIVVNDGRGFYTSRCFGTFTQEGMAMLQDGIAPALIENAARMAGMPVGPLAVSDEVTIDLQWKVMKQEEQDLGAKYKKPAGYDVVRIMCEDVKRPGRRFGGGFYDYPADGRKFLWAGLEQLFPRRADQPRVEEVKKRLLYRQALETARCFEEGVLTQPADGDLGSILGWGFPAYTGGTLSFIDTLGVRTFVDECKRMTKLYGARFRPSRWLAERADAGQDFYSSQTNGARP